MIEVRTQASRPFTQRVPSGPEPKGCPMNRDRWTTVAVGAVLIAATFIFPYTRYWTDARPRQREGFRPLWRQATGPPAAQVGQPGTVLVLWRVTCALAAVEAALFAA